MLFDNWRQVVKGRKVVYIFVNDHYLMLGRSERTFMLKKFLFSLSYVQKYLSWVALFKFDCEE